MNQIVNTGDCASTAEIVCDGLRSPKEQEAVKARSLIPVDRIENRIFQIRSRRVIIDADLARFYGVPTKRLNEQLRRNIARFPEDFAFQLTGEEKAKVVANCDHLNKLKYSKALPYAFTEHGAIMASNILNSDRAIEMGLFVVRAFVNLRRSVAANEDMARNLVQLEKRLTGHDEQLVRIVKAIKSLASTSAVPKKRRIGFGPRKS